MMMMMMMMIIIIIIIIIIIMSAATYHIKEQPISMLCCAHLQNLIILRFPKLSIVATT